MLWRIWKKDGQIGLITLPLFEPGKLVILNELCPRHPSIWSTYAIDVEKQRYYFEFDSSLQDIQCIELLEKEGIAFITTTDFSWLPS